MTRTVLHVIMRKGEMSPDGVMSVPVEEERETIDLADMKSEDLSTQVEAMLHRLVPPETETATVTVSEVETTEV
jgi:hypothetical protein